MTTMTTYRSNNDYRSNEQLQALSNTIIDNLEEIISHFNLNLRRGPKMYVGRCPIHGGDNSTAFNIYHDGYNYKGNWYCNTHHCEDIFQSTPLGFVRGLLSREKFDWSQPKDKICSFPYTIDWCTKFFHVKNTTNNLETGHLEEQKFIHHANGIYNNPNSKPIPRLLTRQEVRRHLVIPSDYYLKRGYTKAILQKYDVGTCTDKNKPMYDRAVFPVYDNDYKYMIGCTGRSIYDKCEICDCYHNKMSPCPLTKYKWQYPKWKHNSEFDSNNWLFNYWNAKDHIKQKGIVIIAESPGNILRLEEAGIHNGVGTFGAKLSTGQKYLLDISGALTIIILTDPDSAGIIAREKIAKMCGSQYRIVQPKLGQCDIGDMSISQVQDLLNPLLEKYHDSV